MSNKTDSLPPPGENQAYFSVSALEAGILRIPLEFFIDPLPADCPPDAKYDTPSLAFLLRHSVTGEYLVFDNGVKKDMDNLPPAMHAQISSFATDTIRVAFDTAERVAAGGLDPAQVKRLIISHAHWDHTGDTTRFPSATIIVGKGTQDLISAGYPSDPNSMYAQDLLPADRTRALDPDDASLGWKPLGPFDKAFDLFGDGSAYVVDAPGHIAGHINLFFRTSSDGGWAFLAGDAAHDWRLVLGTTGVASHSKFGCVHADKAVAEHHIGLIRQLKERYPRVRIILAHDAPMWEKAKADDWEGFWPKTIRSL